MFKPPSAIDIKNWLDSLDKRNRDEPTIGDAVNAVKNLIRRKHKPKTRLKAKHDHEGSRNR